MARTIRLKSTTRVLYMWLNKRKYKLYNNVIILTFYPVKYEIYYIKYCIKKCLLCNYLLLIVMLLNNIMFY